MTTGEFLLTGWQAKPEVWGGGVLLLAGYLALVRPLGRRAWLFGAGVATLVLSLVSPLDTLAHAYLFSAHMAQHLLLTLIVPPLLLLGLPPAFFDRLLAYPPAQRLEHRIGNPLLGWWLATGMMWVWHLPVLYGRALAHEGVHILQHGLFLASAILFWWPLLAPPSARPALAPWTTLVYLFTAMAAGSVLGIVLAFAPPGLYPAYLTPPDGDGLLALVRDGWGLAPADDQQLGGFLMWIPGGFVYSLALFGALARWFAEPEEDAPLPVGATGRS